MKLRTALLIGSAVALPASAVAATIPAVASAAHPGFIAPAHPLILTRELRRQLADGKEVVSRRSYRIQFVPEADGFRVDGALVSADVEAPPALAMLAAIERSRKDDGLFPLRLGRDGLIVGQQGAHDPAAAQQARALVGGAINTIAFTGSDRSVANDMARRIETQVSTAGGNWPSDLFRPAAGQRSSVRQPGLPNGGAGKVTVTITAAPGQTGLLQHLERLVVTELDGTRRESREIWTLTEPG